MNYSSLNPISLTTNRKDKRGNREDKQQAFSGNPMSNSAMMMIYHCYPARSEQKSAENSFYK